jgi:hypothetical protein
VEFAVIAASWALLAILVLAHEPWFDEAQAWLIARDAPLPDLFTQVLRYEGNPGLWHLLLLLPARLGAPYGFMNLLAALLTAPAIYLLVRHSPFPLWLRALLPFSFFLLYQYGVVARPYSMLALLFFLLAMTWPRRDSRPWAYGGLLVALILASPQSMALVAGLLAVDGLDALRHGRLRAYLSVALACLAVAGLVVLELLPPADMSTGFDRRHGIGHVLPALFVLLDGALAGDTPRDRGLFPFGALTSLLGWTMIGIWLARSRRLLLLVVPLALMAIMGGITVQSPWHLGIAFLFLLFVAWVTLQEQQLQPPPTTPGRWPVARARRDALALLGVATCIQLLWTVQTGWYDLREPYSASRNAAAYIRERHVDVSRIYATGFASTSLLPYLDHEAFTIGRAGPRTTYWQWTRANQALEHYPRRLDATTDPNLSAHPDLIVYSIKFDYQYRVPSIPGYHVDRVFSGALYFKGGVLEYDSYVMLVPTT